MVWTTEVIAIIGNSNTFQPIVCTKPYIFIYALRAFGSYTLYLVSKCLYIPNLAFSNLDCQKSYRISGFWIFVIFWMMIETKKTQRKIDYREIVVNRKANWANRIKINIQNTLTSLLWMNVRSFVHEEEYFVRHHHHITLLAT